MRVRLLFAAVVAAVTAFAFAGVASAGLNVVYVFNGNGGYSTDGLGQNSGGGSIQAEVPAGSTVEKAFLLGTYYSGSTTSDADRLIDFDGTMVQLVQISSIISYLTTAEADVTAQVAAKVGSGGGITNFTVNNDPYGLDGVALVVVYSNPALPESTVAVLDGSSEPGGDTTTFTFASPLDKTITGFSAIMSLGSGFSYQGGSGPGTHVCAPDQFSTVDVNGTRLTSCAGNYDDGLGEDGGLITVGGVGDATDNPVDPNNQVGVDDELYDIAGFLDQGDTSAVLTTANPSFNDNLFLAVINITAEATVSNEICDNGIDDDGNGLVDGDDPDCVPPPSEICGDGIDNDGDGQVDEDCPVPAKGRVTGGGSVFTSSGMRVTHGFELHCDAATGPNNLQVNWGKGNRFHLTSLTSAACSDDASISEEMPVAGFDTYTGKGTGNYNGVPGATAEWTFTDAGEPGVADSVTLTIKDAGATTVLTVTGTLSNGNHQAHAD